MKILKNKRGFSLVELMVVVAIMGVLSAIAIPSYLTYQENAKEGVFESMLHIIDRTVAIDLARGAAINATEIWKKVQSNDKKEFGTPTLTVGTVAASGNWCMDINFAPSGKYVGYYGCISNSSSTDSTAPGKKISVLKDTDATAPTAGAISRCSATGTNITTGAVCKDV